MPQPLPQQDAPIDTWMNVGAEPLDSKDFEVTEDFGYPSDFDSRSPTQITTSSQPTSEPSEESNLALKNRASGEEALNIEGSPPVFASGSFMFALEGCLCPIPVKAVPVQGHGYGSLQNLPRPESQQVPLTPVERLYQSLQRLPLSDDGSTPRQGSFQPYKSPTNTCQVSSETHQKTPQLHQEFSQSRQEVLRSSDETTESRGERHELDKTASEPHEKPSESNQEPLESNQEPFESNQEPAKSHQERSE